MDDAKQNSMDGLSFTFIVAGQWRIGQFRPAEQCSDDPRWLQIE